MLAHLREAISLERNAVVSVYVRGRGIQGRDFYDQHPETRLRIEARMVLTASQYRQIGATYEHAAADLTLPPQPRAAFAEKAKTFRMLARMTAAKQAMEPGDVIVL